MRTYLRSTLLVLSASALPCAAIAQTTPPAAPPAAAPAAPAPAPSVPESGFTERLAAQLGRPGGLMADTVATRAAETSFDVAARKQELLAAAAQVDAAMVGYFPRLSALARYTRLSPITPASLGEGSTVVTNAPPGPLNPAAMPPGTGFFAAQFSFPVFLNQYTLQATLNVPISDYLLRIPQAYAAATGSERAARLSEQATRLKVATDGRIAYYTWVRTKLQVVVAEQALEQANAHLADAKHAFDAGTLSKADVLRVESQVASAELVVERAKNLAQLAETQIRIAMHDASEHAYEIGEDPMVDPAPVDGSGAASATLWNEAIANRVELRALDENAGGLREQAKAAKSVSWPRLDGVGNVNYQNPNQRFFPQTDQFKMTWDASLQLSWSPNDIPGGSTAGRQLEARAAALVAQRAQLEDGIRTEVTQAQQNLREANVAVDTSRRGLAASEESYRVRRVLFQNGRATNVELTDAEADLTQARLTLINARIDQRIARARLVHALGRDVAGAK